VTDNFGADGPGSITFANITNGEDSGLTSGGAHITLWLSDNGQTLEGRTGSTDGTDGTLIYTVHIDQANSQYDFTLDAPIDNGSGVSFNNLTSTKAGNTNIYGVGADATGNPDVDAMLSATSGGVSSTINTNVDSIGIGNQLFNPTDSLRIDFVTAMTTDAANATIGFDYAQHVETNLFQENVVKVTGNSNVSFEVWALQTADTDGNFPDSNPSGNFNDSTKETITTVGIEGTNATTQPMVTTTLTTVGQTVTIAYGVTATLQSDGSVIFGNVPQGFTYEVGTGSNSFNAVDVQDVSGSFKLGIFALGTTNFGNPVNLSYDLQVTDGDGDSVTVPGAIAIQLDPNSSTTPIITNSSVINNSSIHTQDVGHTALNTSSLMASNDNLEQQGQRVFSVGQNAALMGALAAAGLDAEHLTLDGHHLALSIGDRPAMMPLETASLGSATPLATGGQQPVHSAEGMPAAQSVQAVQHSAPVHDMVASAHPLGGAVSPQAGPTQLLHGSTAVDGHATAANVHSMTAPAVVMPSAQQLAAAAHGSPQPANSVAGNTAQHEAVVGKVLVDALHGGQAQGPNVDALLHSLPVHAAGANGALQALATHAGSFVSIEHMAMATPFGGPHSMLSVDMVMHQDAPPPAHG
jgi:hypothetical protein